IGRQLVLGRLLLLDRLPDLLGAGAALYGHVQRPKGDVIGMAPVEPLVERRHVDRRLQLVAELSGVGDGLVGVVEVPERKWVIGLSTGGGRVDDGLIVRREESGQSVSSER